MRRAVRVDGIVLGSVYIKISTQDPVAKDKW